MSWYDSAVATIREVTKDLPVDMPLDERMPLFEQSPLDRAKAKAEARR